MIGAKCDLKNRFVKKFLTLKDEHLVYATRQDISVLFPTVLINFIWIAVTAIGSVVFYFLVLNNVSIFLVPIVVGVICIELFIKNLVEWYFHFYIVTNRKIVEVIYRPMFSKVIYEVLIDQVRCTEIDVKGTGLYSEFFNIGTILITFDRPTNEKTFYIKQIKDPRTAALHLADSFEMQSYKEEVNGWLSNPLINTSVEYGNNTNNI